MKTIPSYHFCSAVEWNECRARLSHDWLQVSFLTFLQAWQKELDCAGKDCNIPADLRLKLSEWERRKVELDFLVVKGIDALSPAQLVGKPPLNNLTEEQREWLMQAVHVAWVEQSGVMVRIGELRTAVLEVDMLIGMLISVKPVDRAGIRLYELCGLISHLLTSLPAYGAVS